MPRPGPAKTVAAEEMLAARITQERERLGWSPAGLASRMTQAGCPMTQSAIWKIENGNPRRRITLDEAVAFSRVFDIKMAALLVPPSIAASKEALALWNEHERETERWVAGVRELQRKARRLLELVDGTESQAVVNSLRAEFGEEPLEVVENVRIREEWLRQARNLAGPENYDG